jgi:phosphoadenosine phosphosulfate reductase
VGKIAESSLPVRYTPIEIQQLEERMRNKSAEEGLRWAIDTLGENIALASSFGKLYSTCLLRLNDWKTMSTG